MSGRPESSDRRSTDRAAAAADTAQPPSRRRIARAILPLPFVATIVVPGLILWLGEGAGWEISAPLRALTLALGAGALFLGALLFVSTVRLFATVGRGTLAPWDPPKRLVVEGPYRHVRHPMISGVALVLVGETLTLAASGIGLWLATFVAVNAVYLPAVEEPALTRRFGDDYRRYAVHVPRLLPRLRPWVGK